MKSNVGDTGDLIHHSDRGCQYASREYVDTLTMNNVRISMTEGGDPKDNAQAERINNTMKNELLKRKIFTSVEQVRTAVAGAVEFYNNRRPHMSLGMMTPVEALDWYLSQKKQFPEITVAGVAGVVSTASTCCFGCRLFRN